MPRGKKSNVVKSEETDFEKYRKEYFELQEDILLKEKEIINLENKVLQLKKIRDEKFKQINNIQCKFNTNSIELKFDDNNNDNDNNNDKDNDSSSTLTSHDAETSDLSDLSDSDSDIDSDVESVEDSESDASSDC